MRRHRPFGRTYWRAVVWYLLQRKRRRRPETEGSTADSDRLTADSTLVTVDQG